MGVKLSALGAPVRAVKHMCSSGVPQFTTIAVQHPSRSLQRNHSSTPLPPTHRQLCKMRATAVQRCYCCPDRWPGDINMSRYISGLFSTSYHPIAQVCKLHKVLACCTNSSAIHCCPQVGGRGLAGCRQAHCAWTQHAKLSRAQLGCFVGSRTRRGPPAGKQ